MKTRRKKRPPVRIADNGQATLALDEFLGPPLPPPREKRMRQTMGAYELAVKSARVRSLSGDWSDTTPNTFIGLYAICHEMVYGIEPEELKDKREMKKAIRVAKKRINLSFENDPSEVVRFIKWTWKRQEKKEAWAGNQGIAIKRLNVWGQFSASLVTDYRKEQITQDRRRKALAR